MIFQKIMLQQPMNFRNENFYEFSSFKGHRIMPYGHCGFIISGPKDWSGSALIIGIDRVAWAWTEPDPPALTEEVTKVERRKPPRLDQGRDDPKNPGNPGRAA